MAVVVVVVGMGAPTTGSVWLARRRPHLDANWREGRAASRHPGDTLRHWRRPCVSAALLFCLGALANWPNPSRGLAETKMTRSSREPHLSRRMRPSAPENLRRTFCGAIRTTRGGGQARSPASPLVAVQQRRRRRRRQQRQRRRQSSRPYMTRGASCRYVWARVSVHLRYAILSQYLCRVNGAKPTAALISSGALCQCAREVANRRRLARAGCDSSKCERTHAPITNYAACRQARKQLARSCDS